MATDIAFALGVLALLGRRVPLGLRVFLSALAVADDLGALIVIAVFYTESLDLGAMAMAGAMYAMLVGCAALRVRDSLVYGLLGLVLLYFMAESGVHSTIAGVLVASVIPVSARVDVRSYVGSTRRALDVIEHHERLEGKDTPELTPIQMVAAQIIATNTRHIRPPLHRIEHALGPWVAFLILPVFALTNAGVNLGGVSISAETGLVGLGVLLGLVVGKPVGIVVASWLAVRLGLAALPRGVRWAQMWGVGMLGGIGFTMAIFITGLAFDSESPARDVAKLAVLSGSVVSSVLGVLVLLRCSARQPEEGSAASAPVTMDDSIATLQERLGEAAAGHSGGAGGGD